MDQLIISCLIIAVTAIISIICTVIYRKRVYIMDKVPLASMEPVVEAVDVKTLGKAAHSETVAGFYRYQDDDQIVIQRTAEQQKIFDEYFVVANIRTTDCKPALKITATILYIVAIVFWVLTPLIGVLGTLLFHSINLLWCILSAVIACVCCITGLVLKFLFVKSIRMETKPRALMTDAEYEDLVNAKIESMVLDQRSLVCLGLNAEQVAGIQPIVLRDKVVNDPSLTVYDRERHVYHSSTQYVTYLYFTAQQLYVYKVEFDMCCNMQDEWTSEFFYQDICDISSHTSRNVLKLDEDDVGFEYTTTEFQIIASNASIGFEMDGNNEKIGTVLSMKQKIRERKA